MEPFRITFSFRGFINFLLSLILTLWSYGYSSVKLQSFYPSSLLVSAFPYLSLYQPSFLHLLHCVFPWASPNPFDDIKHFFPFAIVLLPYISSEDIDYFSIWHVWKTAITHSEKCFVMVLVQLLLFPLVVSKTLRGLCLQNMFITLCTFPGESNLNSAHLRQQAYKALCHSTWKCRTMWDGTAVFVQANRTALGKHPWNCFWRKIRHKWQIGNNVR